MELGRDDNSSCSESRNDVNFVSAPEESSANAHSSAAVTFSLTSGNRREFRLLDDSGGDASK